jgi:hypothetical protein
MELEKKRECDCAICNRSRKFKKHLETVTDKDAKNFFEDIFNYLYEVEEERDCFKIYSENLHNLYPRIWKEVTTIQKLHRDDAEFPEKQL